jgi:hypothetical protein
MKRIIELIIKIDDWLTKVGLEMYPNLTNHMKDKKWEIYLF